jgi:hypothetical protein
LSLDPLAVDYVSWSAYNYVLSNPVYLIDSDGKSAGPPDLIVQNTKGNEIARIVLPGEDQVLIVNTELKPPSPVVVDPFEGAGDAFTPDAVGISIEYAGVVGGGIVAGIEIVHFFKGDDAGKNFKYTTFGGGVGLDGSIGVTGFYSNFNREAAQGDFNAKGMAGKFSGYSAGVGVGGSYEWSSESGRGELFPGHHGKKTWESTSIVGGFGGEVGFKINWGTRSEPEEVATDVGETVVQ